MPHPPRGGDTGRVLAMYRVLSAWRAKAPSSGLGYGSLCCGDIGDGGEEHLVVVVGDEKGMVRIYEPSATEVEGGFSAGNEEAACEVDLGEPIRQVEMAVLSGGAMGQPALCVMHEMHIALFTVRRVVLEGGEGEVQVKPMAAPHKLPAPGFSMAVFSKGGQGGRPTSRVMVMSETGDVTVVDGGTEAWYARPPRPVLCPGPFLAMPAEDRVFFCHGGFEVQAYGLEAYLEQYHTDREGLLAAGGGGGKGPAWEALVGEIPVGMVAVNQAGRAGLRLRSAAVAVLGDHSLTYLSAKDGAVVGQRTVDEPAVLLACTEGGAPDAGTMQLVLVVTHANNLLAFHGTVPVWVASYESRPLGLRVLPNSSTTLSGYLCTLREDGEVTTDFLGTRLVGDLGQSADAADTEELDYVAASEQYRMMLHFIAETTEEGLQGEQGAKKRNTMIELSTEVIELGESGMTVLAQLSCGVNGKAPLGNVHLSAHFPDFLDCPENSFSVEVSPEAGSVEVPISFFARGESTSGGDATSVWEKDVVITAAYNTASGEPRVACSSLAVPLSMYAPTAQASPSYRYTYTVRSNVGAVSLIELLGPGGVLYPGGSLRNGQLCMELPGPADGDDRSCVVEDCGDGTFRVMGGSLWSFFPVLSALKMALASRAKGGTAGPAMTCQDSLPMEEFGLVVSEYGELRRSHNAMLDAVEKNTQQFYSIQRRLLSSIGETKDDVLVKSLSSLLTKTYGQLVELGHAYAQEKHKHLQSLSNLGNLTQLILLLLECRPSHAGPVDIPTLSSLLSPSMSCENQLCGWEDRINASINHLSHLGVVDSPAQSRTRDTELLADSLKHAFLVSDAHY